MPGDVVPKLLKYFQEDVTLPMQYTRSVLPNRNFYDVSCLGHFKHSSIIIKKFTNKLNEFQ